MLEVKQFDTTSVQELIQELKDSLTKEANVTLYDSDLEVVLLELCALMIDMQNYTMDVTTDEMKKAMATFLFEEDLSMRCAIGMLVVQPEYSSWMLANTMFDPIAKLPFTSANSTYVQANSIVALTYHQESYSFPLSRQLILRDDKPLIITLSSPLEIDQPCSIYVKLKEANAKPDCRLRQAKLVLLYESVHGLCDAEICKDETFGLLASGILTFTIHKEHRQSSTINGYQLRIMLKESIMDAYPCIYDIYLNPIKIRQEHNLAVTYRVPVRQTLRIQDALAASGHVSVMAKTKDCLKPCAFTKSMEEDGVAIHIQHLFMEEEEELYIILQDQALISDGILASTTGVSMQQVPLPYDDILHMTLLIQQGDGWHEAKVYEQGTFLDVERYGAWIDYENHCLQFGCGKDFLIPERGIDNVIISELTLTKGSLGNINAHVLTKKPYMQPYAIQGGSDHKQIDEFIDAIPELLRHQHPITTCEDVCELIRRFPGNHLTHIVCHRMHKAKDIQMLGYDILLKAEKPLHKRYITQLTIWLKDRLPIGIPFHIIEARLLQISLNIDMIPVSSSIRKEQVKSLILIWMKQQPSDQPIIVSSLVQTLQQANVAQKIERCYFIVDEKQVDQYRIPMECICEIAPIHIQFLSQRTKGEAYE